MSRADELVAKARDWVLETMETGAGHDPGHVRRVVTNAERLGEAEGADLLVVRLAAWMHDVVNLDKDDPERDRASRRSARAAVEWLDGRLDEERTERVAEAIRCHSYSAGLEPESLEAKVVSDADNLDAIGAIGIARCFEVGGQLGRPTLAPEDPFCEQREPDDDTYTLDHFFEKLLRLEDRFYTEAGRAEARGRIEFMEWYLEQLGEEISC